MTQNQTSQNASPDAVVISRNTLKRAFAALAVISVLASALLWGRQFIALASEFIDSFTDTSRIDDTWNLTVDTAAGEVKLAEKSCDSAVWICDQAATCVNTFGDGEYILVASTSVSGTKQWKTANTNCDLPQCGQDGGQDGDNLDADNTLSFNQYPARQACKDMGGRLPTISELQCIYTNRASFNNNFGTGNHWSSTEYSEMHARYVYFSDGLPYNGSKTLAYAVRCVRGW